MALTAAERASFRADQIAQIDRVRNVERLFPTPERQDTDTDAEYRDRVAAARAKTHGQLANMTPDQLRARVNVGGFRNSAPSWSEDNDYTAGEQEAIEAGYLANAGRAWGREIPKILAHDAEMSADGLTAATRKAILKARGGT